MLIDNLFFIIAALNKNIQCQFFMTVHNKIISETNLKDKMSITIIF